jgi:hypothetical protein
MDSFFKVKIETLEKVGRNLFATINIIINHYEFGIDLNTMQRMF